MSTKRNDPKYMRAYARGMLRSAFVSLFWGIISELKKRKGFTLQSLANTLGTNKGEVSRWFNGDPNWTINTIANIADALNVEIRVQAVDRITGEIYTSAGLQIQTIVQSGQRKSIMERMETDPPLPTFIVKRPSEGFKTPVETRAAA
jgi:transcriptional regulator with XRE-family HTH domain